jgi:hypothetical protein
MRLNDDPYCELCSVVVVTHFNMERVLAWNTRVQYATCEVHVPRELHTISKTSNKISLIFSTIAPI